MLVKVAVAEVKPGVPRSLPSISCHSTSAPPSYSSTYHCRRMTLASNSACTQNTKYVHTQNTKCDWRATEGSWLKGQIFWLLFRGCWVWISARTPTVLTGVIVDCFSSTRNISVTLQWGYMIVLWLFYLVCILYCGCFNLFCNMWVCVCVGVLTIEWVFW